MDLVLADDPDGRIADAARKAAADAGIALSADRRPDASAWWRAGLAEALERLAAGLVPGPYDAARSPRRRRGATRA